MKEEVDCTNVTLKMTVHIFTIGKYTAYTNVK